MRWLLLLCRAALTSGSKPRARNSGPMALVLLLQLSRPAAGACIGSKETVSEWESE
jgi:hypothetical protein